jgi:hypothetical protein
MPGGSIAWIFAGACTIIVAIIGALVGRHGNLLKRGTDMTGIYMTRLKDTEVENDKLTDKVQALREQHILDLAALEKVVRLEKEVADLKVLLNAEKHGIGGAEPPDKE